MSLLLLFKSGGLTQNCSGSVTASGILVKQISKQTAGTSTATGALLKLTSRALTGSVTATGVLVKLFAMLLTGSVTASGVLEALRVIFQTITGSCTPAGDLIKMTGKALAGSVTSTGALGRRIAKVLTGSVTAIGSLVTSYLYGGINILVNGVAAVVRMAGITIFDAINDAPNTCSLSIVSPAPQTSQSLEVLVGTTPLFSGALQAVSTAYDLKGTNLVYPCSAIDDTNKANMKRPFGTWTNTSATTVGQSLVADFASSFSDAGIDAGLPDITITFDGSETFIACFARMSKLIGGYCKVEDGVVYLFLTDVTALPDDITDSNLPLNDPPILRTVDDSQLRTRVYGKGYGELVPTDVSAGETIIPITNGVSFTQTGGQAITATTAEGAQFQIIDYTGVTVASGGSVVGVGAAPTNAPTVALAAGSGVNTGDHEWAYVFKTAAGRTRPSPLAALSIGFVAAPTSAPTAGSPTAGTGPDDGVHEYAISNVTAAGETPPGPRVSVTTTSRTVTPPTSSTATALDFSSANAFAIGDTVYLGLAYLTAAGQTTATATNSVTAIQSLYNPGIAGTVVTVITASADAAVTGIRVHCNVNGSWVGYVDYTNSSMAVYIGYVTAGSPVSPSTAIVRTQVVPLSGLQLGGALVTDRKLWGTPAGSSQLKYIANIGTSATTASVTTPDASLGTNAPTSNTAAANRASVTVPAGPTGTTDIEVFRTVAGATGLSNLKLTFAVGSNTAGTYTDSTADASLGAAAPSSDTSGLTQVAGQVNAGSTTLLIASPAPFSASGGWVFLSGDQIVRYTGISGNSLTGIPASGVGSLATTVLYGSQALPSPALTGVTGLALAMARGSKVNIWVQVDDVTAQAAQAARAGSGDGIVEYTITDERRVEESLTALCEASLALFAYPIITVRYACRDIKTKSGKQITFNLSAPPIAETLTIQSVVIDQIGTNQGLRPRFTATASNVRFSLEDTLRRLVALSTAR